MARRLSKLCFLAVARGQDQSELPRIVSLIRQRVAAGMAHHVDVNLEREVGAIAADRMGCRLCRCKRTWDIATSRTRAIIGHARAPAASCRRQNGETNGRTY